VVIEHAFGTTTLTEKPVRIATVGWANHEVPLALGIVPVGMARTDFGDDNRDGVLPWVEARLTELGAGTPPLFDEGDGIDFEAVAATRPDVILAAYSGLSQTEYDTLSRIAPVVAYPEGRWTTDWRDMIRQNGAGLGMADEAAALTARLEAQIAAARDAHPEITGKSAMFITHLDARDLSVIRFYSANDSRVKFFEDLGLASPRAVADASDPGSYAGAVSAERIDDFADVDILVTYGDSALLDRLQSNELAGRMEAIRKGAVVLLGNDPLGNSANPTPLAIPWVLDHYVTLLSNAALKSE
jgi:iron complex transport system substrate-binding protein